MIRAVLALLTTILGLEWFIGRMWWPKKFTSKFFKKNEGKGSKKTEGSLENAQHRQHLEREWCIHRAPIDEGYKKEVVIDHNIVTADGLAIDWVYSHLYWTDTGTNSICVSDLDGNLVTNVIQDSLEEPRAIALHPAKG